MVSKRSLVLKMMKKTKKGLELRIDVINDMMDNQPCKEICITFICYFSK
jgi:hypothetical protein